MRHGYFLDHMTSTFPRSDTKAAAPFSMVQRVPGPGKCARPSPISTLLDHTLCTQNPRIPSSNGKQSKRTVSSPWMMSHHVSQSGEWWSCQIILLVFSWNQFIYYLSNHFPHSFRHMSNLSVYKPTHQSTHLPTHSYTHPPTHPPFTSHLSIFFN